MKIKIYCNYFSKNLTRLTRNKLSFWKAFFSFLSLVGSKFELLETYVVTPFGYKDRKKRDVSVFKSFPKRFDYTRKAEKFSQL